jgi:hypothetical protein
MMSSAATTPTGGTASAMLAPAAAAAAAQPAALSEEDMRELQGLGVSIKALQADIDTFQTETRVLDIASARGLAVDAGLHLQKKQLLLSLQIDQLAAKIRQAELRLLTAATPEDKAALQADKAALQQEKILLLEQQQRAQVSSASGQLTLSQRGAFCDSCLRIRELLLGSER